MKNLFLILFACLPAFAQTSLNPIRLENADFPQSSPLNTVQIFARDYAATDGLAGMVWRMENSGFAALHPTSDSFARFAVGHIQALTSLDIRGTPVLNAGLFWMNDQHTWTGSSGTGPGWVAAVGQTGVFTVQMLDSITSDNAYNVDVGALNGIINGNDHKNLRLFSVDSAGGTLYQMILSHAGFVSFPYGLIQGTDTNLVFQGDTNASGVGGEIRLEAAPTKFITLGGGIKMPYREAGSSGPILTNDMFVLATASITLTNMDVSDVGSGRTLYLGVNSGETLTIEARAGDSIEGGSTYVLTNTLGNDSLWVGLTGNGVAIWKVFSIGNQEVVIQSSLDNVIQNFGNNTIGAVNPGFNAMLVWENGATHANWFSLGPEFDFDDVTDSFNIAINGLSTNRLQQIPQDTFLGRTSSGTGDVEIVPFSAIGGSANNTNTFAKTLTNNDTNHIFTVTLASGGMSGLIVEGTISATDSVDFQSFTAQWSVSCVNKATAFSQDVDEANQALAVSSGAGIVPIVTFDDNGSNAYVFVLDPASGLTTTSVIFRYTIKNLTGNTITIH